MKLRFAAALTTGLLFFFLLMLVSGLSPGLFIDVASLLAAVVLPHVVLSFIVSPREQVQMFRAILGKEEADADLLTGGITFLVRLKTVMITMAFGTMIFGVIGMMANLANPEMLGPNFAIALIVIFYAALYIGLVIEPLRLAAERKLGGLE
ncbi:MAG: hypothetical protein PQJ60_07025 [Spirochaetales bacterium]|nr:hypothetical protein [Spirochaetales bacterium]